MADTPCFTDHFLIAMPALEDPNFQRSVTLVCQHDANGAMGIVINRAADYTLGLVVREVPRPFTLPLSQIEPTPEFVQDPTSRDKYLEGIAKLADGGIIIVLDMRKLLTPSEVMKLPGKK